MSEKKMFVCPRCGKLRAVYQTINGNNLCQVCYRKILEEYSFYDYKTPKSKLSGNALKICELLIEEGVDRKVIHEKLGLHKVYVQQVIKKHTVRVNKDGKIRPF